MTRILALLLTLYLTAPLDISQDQAPPADASARAQLRALGNASYFLALANMTGLTGTLEADGPFTIFAPLDDAFVYLPGDEFEALMADPDALLEVLSYHIVPGIHRAEDLLELSSLITLSGETINLEPSDTGPRINEANVVVPDILASNGIIHLIDAVLRPDTGEITPPA